MENNEIQEFTLPAEFEENFPQEAAMLVDGKIVETIEAFDNRLTDALETGDAAQAEKITASQMFIAAILNEQESFKSIRAMRLELFVKTGQQDKARKEYDALSLHCSKAHLSEILALTGYDPSAKETKPVNREMLDAIEIYFIVDMLRVYNNGVLHSVMRRMTAMHELWGYSTFMVTCEYSIQHQSVIADLMHFSGHKTSNLPKGVQIRSVYEYFQRTHETDALIEHKPQSDPNLRYERHRKDFNVFDVYNENDVKLRTEWFVGPFDRLRYMEHFDEAGVKTHDTLYDDYGHASRIRHYDKDNPKHHTHDLHYTTEGNLCISKEYEHKDEKHPITSSHSHVKNVILYDDNGNIIKICEDDAELASVYLERVAVSTNKLCIFVNEGGLFSKALIGLPFRNVKTASVLHSTALENPYDLTSKPQIYFKNMMEYQDSFDALIFLTNEARRDFFALHGASKRTFTVPHFYPKKITPIPFESRDPKKVVIISRYDPVKRLDLAVQIFKMVCSEVEDLTLDIYGYGPEREEKRVRDAIEDFNLQDKVRLLGPTESPDKIFASAAAFMLTSHIEGYAITVMESICNGCVPFSFDIKYGPNEIIKQDETGFLTIPTNIKRYAQQMVTFFSDPELQKTMSEACYKDAHRFSREVFLEQWHEMLEDLCYG